MNSADLLAQVHAKSKTRAKQVGLQADPFEDPLPYGFFLAADVIVLGVAGFAAGCLGFLFIGLSLKPKGWPGMMALDVGCLLGISVYQRMVSRGIF